MIKPSDYLKQGWCQDLLSVDDTGKYVDPLSVKAVQWCMYGSIMAAEYKTYGTHGGLIYGQLRKNLTQTIGSIDRWNNASERTKDEVIIIMEQAEKEVGL